jgi:glycosyltransferase involved in cell wall biosynthesis
MRVIIATVQVPFVQGGAEIHAAGLLQALTDRGHEAEIVAAPFKWYPPERVLDHMLACRLLDLTEAEGKRVDALIALKFPAYLIPHPSKIIWLLHQHRQAYDLWDDPLAGDLFSHQNGSAVRDAILNADRQLIPEARAVFSNSRNVAQRLKQFCGIDSIALYHPPRGEDLFFSAEPEKYFFFPSRLVSTKRQELVLRAIAETRQQTRVKFAGASTHPQYASHLAKLAEKLGVAARVEWLGVISEGQKRDLYARCLGVIYPPLDEDFGYITLEAMLSGKAVVTCTDSGGPLEFVDHAINGLIAEPEPKAMAEALDAVWGAVATAKRLGSAGREKYLAMGISWDKVVDSLLGTARPS